MEPELSVCTIGIALTASICRKAPGGWKILSGAWKILSGRRLLKSNGPQVILLVPLPYRLPASEYREHYRLIVYGYSAPLKRQTRGLPHLYGCPTRAWHGVECSPHHMAANPIQRLCGVRRLRFTGSVSLGRAWIVEDSRNVFFQFDREILHLGVSRKQAFRIIDRDREI